MHSFVGGSRGQREDQDEQGCAPEPTLSSWRYREVRRPILLEYLFIACSSSIAANPDIKYGKRVHVLPIDDTVQGITG